jgi:hypothetical protein
MKDPRMILGAALLLMMFILAETIALGKVHQETSFGLQELLGSFQTLAGAFAGWAFGRSMELPPK